MSMQVTVCAAVTTGIPAYPSSNQNPFSSSASPKPAATNQNPFAVSSTSPAQGAVATAASNANDVSGATTVNGGGGVIRDKPVSQAQSELTPVK